MAKVTLVNPNRMKPAVAPLALEYLAESLHAAGHEVDLLDLCFSDNWEADVDMHFADRKPDVIGMTIRNTDDCYFASRDFFIPFHKQVIGRIRLQTNSPIVLGGAGLSVAPVPVMEFSGADYAIRGDGEFAFPVLADRLSRGQDESDIPGLLFRTDGGIRANWPEWRDLSELPIRSRRWLDNRRYFSEGGQAGIETKRGCDKACIYCADPASKGRKCRLRPPEHIVAEIRALLDQGIDCLHLCDAEFNVPLRHAESVCQAILESGLAGKLGWYTYASAAPFGSKLARLMKDAGCLGIDFGADSGDDDVLRALGRDFTVDDVRRTAEICHQQDITFMYDLLIGGPGETRGSVRRTIDLMKEISPSRVGLSIGMRVYNGTVIGNLVRREGITRDNPNLHGVIDGNESFLAPIYYLSAELGRDIDDYITDLIGGDPRFFHASMNPVDSNYNYNDNSVLVQAIKAGHRGAYWNILRKLHEELLADTS